MLSKEKFATEIVNIAIDGNGVALVDGIPRRCNGRNTPCEKCDLYDGTTCNKNKLKEWAESEYMDPFVKKWKDVPIDTPVVVWNDDNLVEQHGHFSGIQNGKILTFQGGSTSWTRNDYEEIWDYARLATEEEIQKAREIK